MTCKEGLNRIAWSTAERGLLRKARPEQRRSGQVPREAKDTPKYLSSFD